MACMHRLEMCVTPVMRAYEGLSETEVLERLSTTDLTETCGYVGLGHTENLSISELMNE